MSNAKKGPWCLGYVYVYYIYIYTYGIILYYLATFPASWSPQKVVKSKGILGKRP